ncbi:MAG TPA: PASTA domain-containing protein [Longimicrobium sp.]|nr:PASTA domain-containing protein [Longimicrobium sp.]
MPPPLRRILLFLALLLPWAGELSAQFRTMPDVRGRTREEAVAILANMDLTPASITEVDSRRTPGTVVSQTPAPGSDLRTASGNVTLTIARARVIQIENITMPDVRGMPEAEALATLRRVGLPIVRVDSSFVEGERAGLVISQRPSPGSDVIQGTPSRITLARSGPAAPQTVAMPNLVGQPLDRARRLLQRARLGAGEITTEASPGAASRVLRQSVPAGQRVERGTAVALVVSTTAPVVARVQVPDLSGRTLAEARALLAQATLALGATDEIDSDRARAGTIFGQQPAPGATVNAGSAVTVAVARQRLAVVPRLTSLSLTAAQARLREAGLRAGAVERTESESRPANSVIAQSIAAGSRVPPGTAIGLDVAIAPIVEEQPTEPQPQDDPQPVDTAVADTTAVARPDTSAVTPVTQPVARVDSLLVPRVIGMTLAEARKALADAGLAVKADSGIADSLKVEAQRPEAGTRAARGTAVALTFPGDGTPVPWWAVVVVVVALVGLKLLFDARERRRILGGAREVVEAVAAGGASAAAHAAAVSVSIRPASREAEFEVDGNPLRGVNIGLRVRPGEPEAVLVAGGELIANKEIHHA